MNNKKEITINPELPIGTEFWIMRNNKPVLGLIAAYKVYVTSCTERGRSWHEQLFSRFITGKHKDVFEIDIQYEVKLENDISMYNIRKKHGKYEIVDRQIYFSLEELKNSL